MKAMNGYGKQRKKKKMHIEERIGFLFDKGSFRPLDGGWDCTVDSVLTGKGKIERQEVYMYAHNAVVKGGTVGLQEGKRIRKLIERAVRHGLPVIGIQDSGGARIQEGILALAGYGEVLKAHAMAAGIVPQIMIVAGSCAGGAVYAPGIADFTFMVEDIGYMFVTGPDVTEKCCGQTGTKEETGGAGIHGVHSGAAHFCCQSEAECLGAVRRLIQYLSDAVAADRIWKRIRMKKRCFCRNSRNEESGRSGLRDIVPANGRKVYDIRKVIEKITDSDSFLEIRKDFARNIVIGFGKMNGRTVGVVANQPMETAGALDCNASVKGAAFVKFCNAYRIPIITLADTPGFLPGAGQERNGLIRHGAKLLFAYAEADTVKLTIILRKAYGGAYICMGSKSLGANRVYAWPGAEAAVMGAECAISVLDKKRLAEMEEKQKQKWIKERAEEYRAVFLKENMKKALDYGCIDGWLEPDDTREQLLRDLEYCGKKKRYQRRYGSRGKKYGLTPL